MNGQTQEVIVYRNPGEQWYWHHLGEAWTFIALLAVAIYIVFWPFLLMYFRGRPRYEVPNIWHALLLTLFWPITLPITRANSPH